MPTTSKTFFRGAATTNTATTLYTVPASTSAVVTEIIVANAGASAGTFTISVGGTVVAPTIAVGGNDGTILKIKQPLTTGQTIVGGASATTINFHITGVEIV